MWIIESESRRPGVQLRCSGSVKTAAGPRRCAVRARGRHNQPSDRRASSSRFLFFFSSSSSASSSSSFPLFINFPRRFPFVSYRAPRGYRSCGRVEIQKKTTTRNQKFISHNRTKTSKRFQCGSASEFVELFYRFIACYGRCGMMRFSFLFLFQLFWVEYKARFEEPLCVLHWIFFSLSFAQWTTHGPPRRVHCGPCFALSRSLHFIFFPR